MRPIVDISGQKFGYWLVEKCAGRKDGHHVSWICRCVCGQTKEIDGSQLRAGKTKSCGCMKGAQISLACKGRPGGNRKHDLSGHREYELWFRAKMRAKQRGLAFSIKPTDITIPEICPLLDIAISRLRNNTSPDSPSLDRIDSSKGYIEENIWVISQKANTLKSNGTLEDHERLVRNWQNIIRQPK